MVSPWAKGFAGNGGAHSAIFPEPDPIKVLRAIWWEGVEASSYTGSKEERSPEKAKDLYCSLNKKKIE